MKKKIGFIGLGTMGMGMAKNIVKKGFPLTVYDLVEDSVNELVQMGAVAVSSPKQVGQNSEVVILMVPADSDVEAVLLGENGVLEGIDKGGTIIVMGTVSPLFMKHLAEIIAKKELRILDAPVFRGPKATVEGTLGIMVGGKEETLEDCHPILAAMGTDIFHCGDIGMGEVVKIVNNYLILINNLVACEAMVLGVKLGAKADTLLEMISSGSGDSYALRRWGQWVLKGNFEPGMKIDFAIKDLQIAINNAKKLSLPLFIGTLSEQIYEYASAMGKGNKDMVSWTRFLEKIAGIEVRSEKAS